MSFLSHLFAAKPKPAPIISGLVNGIINSMAAKPGDWERRPKGCVFIHLPTGLTVAPDSEYDVMAVETYPAFEMTRDEHKALYSAWHVHLERPYQTNLRLANSDACRKVRAHFES